MVIVVGRPRNADAIRYCCIPGVSRFQLDEEDFACDIGIIDNLDGCIDAVVLVGTSKIQLDGRTRWKAAKDSSSRTWARGRFGILGIAVRD